MKAEVRQRLKWIRMYEASRDTGLVCRRCGVFRPTLRKWLRRYEALGMDGLESQSRRPHRSPGRKVKEDDRQLILQMRRLGQGARRIQSELRLHHAREFALDTIHKVLVSAKVRPLSRPRRPQTSKRYSRQVPGDRVQMDTMKIAAGCTSTPPWMTAHAGACWASTRAAAPPTRSSSWIGSSRRCLPDPTRSKGSRYRVLRRARATTTQRRVLNGSDGVLEPVPRQEPPISKRGSRNGSSPTTGGAHTAA